MKKSSAWLTRSEPFYKYVKVQCAFQMLSRASDHGGERIALNLLKDNEAKIHVFIRLESHEVRGTYVFG